MTQFELKETIFRKKKRKKIEIFEKSQVTWYHNGQKYFFRFFRLRMTQFEKINEKKKFENFEIFQKNSKSQIMWPHNGEISDQIFFIAFLESEWLNSWKKAKKFFLTFWLRGWPYMTSSEWNVPRLRVKDILDVGLTYMVRKVFVRAIFWEIFSKIVRLKLEQYQKGSFLTPKIPHILTPTFFFENRAWLLVINFPEESLCKKSKKSLEPFAVTFAHPTN